MRKSATFLAIPITIFLWASVAQGYAENHEEATATSSADSALVIQENFVPATEEIYAWIQTVFDRGIRRPGYEADVWAEEWIADQFRDFGCEQVRLEPVDVLQWTDDEASLTVWPPENPGNKLTFPGFPVPYSASTDGLEANLVALPGEAKGAIATRTIRLLPVPGSLRAFATRVYDPDNEFASLLHTVPFGGNIMGVMDPAEEAGAVGFVGLLTGFPWDTQDYYVPYDAVARPLPGIYLSKSNSAQLNEKLASGPLRANLVAKSSLQQITSHNIVATLPGTGDESIIIGSHHDGPWASAVEDASGIALVLAQAKYWSQIPESERPHNLVFLLNAGHMAGGAGCQAYIKAHETELEAVVAEIHLEHAAREAKGVDGALVTTEKPEVRWWWVSEIDALEDIVENALRAESLGRSLILRPTAIGERPSTDGSYFHTAGVPIVHYLTAPMYLFDSQDTMDKIHEESLVPVTRATIRMVNDLADQTATGLRAAVRDSKPPPTIQESVSQIRELEANEEQSK